MFDKQRLPTPFPHPFDPFFRPLFTIGDSMGEIASCWQVFVAGMLVGFTAAVLIKAIVG